MKKKILLIDDDLLVLKSLRMVLEREGYETAACPSAQEGIEKVKGEHFDLVISDIRMPGKNGVEAIREIRALFEHSGAGDVPIVFITGYATMSDELDAEKLGEVILKPFDMNRLLMTIREYL